MKLPPIVSTDEWATAREELLADEKRMTRALDALAARRRRLPVVEFGKEYRFEGTGGAKSLAGLFDGRRQLIVYHFMMEAGSDHRCPGCSAVADSTPHLAHLHARDTTYVLTSPAPLSQLEPFRLRMGWDIPWYSTTGSDFEADCGVGGGFGISVFIRSDDDRVFRSYFTASRGVDQLRNDLALLDLTPYGRQETWEDSPEGWPQTPAYQWWRLHDRYGD
ncbi:DUF899 domain-containing protein [Kribbella deserti]|uniref:DUF899 domain-containing protein n=1 Tax=Kribbella deserti TaxID=1926257 RepID=A0ABV6QFE1_9ACTN